jgi:uncharacterized membrane protein YccC
MVIDVPLGVVDFIAQRESALVYVVMAARAVTGACAALVFMRIASLTTPRARDRLMLLWAGIVALASVTIVLSRPPGFGAPLAMGMVIIAAFALVLPGSLRYQLAATAFLVVAFVAARVVRGPVGGTPALFSTLGVLTVGVALSVFASRRKQRTRRELFLAMHEQRTLRTALEVALAEIRTLRGIVPFCSFCHKVRDEAGTWHRVEAYVSERTHAEFSHGFCPTCEATHYPEAA